jgi:cystathionine gamma-synthase
MTDPQPPASKPNSWKPRTRAAQAIGMAPTHDEPITGAVVPPVHMATTYLRDPDNQYRSGYVYGRPDNATVRQAEAVLAGLEGAEQAALFGSGMAAATAVVLALGAGAHVVAPREMYWAFRHWLLDAAPRLGIQADCVDMTDMDALRAAIRPGKTKLVWVETPSNPLWSITDIAAAAAIAHQAGAMLAVDSTVATPVFAQPLKLGADIVMHSATKYLNGHSDVIAGVLACARSDDLWSRILSLRSQHGAILGPFEAWLLLRGMRTLDVRVRTQAESAALLAVRLGRHPQVASVLYPGLPAHPGAALAAQQMTGFGGMLSVRVKGGEAAAIGAAARVELWKRATSLGGAESLIEHRASIEGANSPCPPDLLRLSVGLEDPEDLYNDLDRALRAANA